MPFFSIFRPKRFTSTSAPTAKWCSNPICSIEDLSIHALTNKSHNFTNTTNTAIFFDLNLHNENDDKGIYYDALTLTLYQPPNLTTPVGSSTYPGFYQGHSTNTHLPVEARELALTEAVWNGSGAVFRVKLEMTVRFKIVWWKSKRHHLVVTADVKVNGFGRKVEKKGIRLTSAAPKDNTHAPPVR